MMSEKFSCQLQTLGFVQIFFPISVPDTEQNSLLKEPYSSILKPHTHLPMRAELRTPYISLIPIYGIKC
jgi:hypothetical protein